MSFLCKTRGRAGGYGASQRGGGGGEKVKKRVDRSGIFRSIGEKHNGPWELLNNLSGQEAAPSITTRTAFSLLTFLLGRWSQQTHRCSCSKVPPIFIPISLWTRTSCKSTHTQLGFSQQCNYRSRGRLQTSYTTETLIDVNKSGWWQWKDTGCQISAMCPSWPVYVWRGGRKRRKNAET